MNAHETIIKSTSQILKDNICTLFNLFNALIAAALALVGAWSNMLFILVIALNTAIGIIQELHARKLVKELSVLSAPDACVLRNGQPCRIPVEAVQLDDMLLLESGSQICADSVLTEGEAEVNESVLTGESDAVLKKAGDTLLSGSFVVSGKCCGKVIHVGKDNFAEHITAQARKIKQSHSELMLSMRKVTRFTGFLIVPLGVLLFAQAFFFRGSSSADSVVSTAAALLGMLPKGLVLLISVCLAIGVSRLARSNVLVQDLFSLETLAHVDTLCLDKTGTLTEGKMQVSDVLDLDSGSHVPLNELIGSFLHFSDDNNATFHALHDYFGENTQHVPEQKVPFSSQRKWSAMSFENAGTLAIGAPERFYPDEVPEAITSKMDSGFRVLVVGWSSEGCAEEPFSGMIPLKAVLLSDPVRKGAADTLAKFRHEGIAVKIISGDHPSVVSFAAKKARLPGYDSYIDMSTIACDEDLYSAAANFTIFGRVTPDQKKQLVQAMKDQGHSVAMAGDGVNDILAMREADCSITVAESSDAARQTAKIVLLDSDFSSLLPVLWEGRRVVHNITKVASVFFIKTIYSILVSILCVIGNLPFPFIPIQITLIDMAIEGYPAFFMSLEPDKRKVTHRFLPQVLRKAVPNALATALMAVLIPILVSPPYGNFSQSSLLLYLVTAALGMEGVLKAAMPLNRLHVFLFVTMLAGFPFAVFLVHNLLQLPVLDLSLIPVLLALLVISIMAERIFSFFCEKIFHKLTPEKPLRRGKPQAVSN